MNRYISKIMVVLLVTTTIAVCSCGKKTSYSEQQLKELEACAEKGDVEAIHQLVDYYGNTPSPIPLSMNELAKLKKKSNKTPAEIQMLKDHDEWMEKYEKWSQAEAKLEKAK